MSSTGQPKAATLGLFEKRFDGDDSLLELARRRFLEARMGAEMHAGIPEQLKAVLRFRHGDNLPVVVHLPRGFDLIEERSQNVILQFASSFAGEVLGLVIHDHPRLGTHQAQYVEAAWNLEKKLERISGPPLLFVEYAAGLEPAQFAQFFEAIRDLEWLSGCIDIGHVGIRAAQSAYSRKHPGEDVCALKSQGPRLQKVMEDVDIAVQEGAAAVLGLLESLASLNKPLHFHLHDGHPLSIASPFGVSDHLSFTSEISLSFEHNGCRAAPVMYGPAGMAKLVRRALKLLGPRRVSFTLEIHPTGLQLPLGDAAPLFSHWSDKTNAERMNHWVSILVENHRLLLEAIQPH